MTNCAYCGSPAHIWWDCQKKPAGWKPGMPLPQITSGGSSAVERMPSKQTVGGSTPPPRSKKSTAARKDVQGRGRNSGSPAVATKASKPTEPDGVAGVTLGRKPSSEVQSLDPAGTQAPPVDTKQKRKDTRKGDRHKPGYWADYLRERRAKLKAKQESQ